MLYRIFKIIVGAAFRFYFRKITIIGRENIPDKGPLLMLCNHPSSFMEAMLLACFQHRTLHFLVRGDMFEKKWLKPILTLTNQIPIFRRRDGFEKLRNNRSTFEYCFDILSQNKAVLIFPEANTSMVRYLRPLQKGAARLAIGTLTEREVRELTVIPCGVNFRNILKSGDDALVIFGKGISIRNFLNNHPANSEQLEKLTQLFTDEMDQVVLSIPEGLSVELYDQLCDIVWPKNLNKLIGQELKTWHDSTIQAMQKQENNLIKLVTEYTDQNRKIRELEFYHKNSFLIRLGHQLGLFLAFIFGIPGFVLFCIPLALGRWFGVKKIKSKEFIPPVRLAVTILLVLIELILLFFIGYAFLPAHTVLLILMCSLISLYLMVYFIQHFPDKKASLSPGLKKIKKEHQLLRMQIVELVRYN
ncbi:MAG: 1-acyl-sn-glycerol-3-phosphate acyltransferase [Saprospiraceae bacterium]|nr:1-acyl-sn-glycerol-3-phosphate acyltransferase [Saprospiraceae bacterium]